MYDQAKRQRFIAKAQEVYEALKGELEPARQGEIVGIHPESGDHFLGRTLNDADQKAFAKYPDQWLYFVRIGSPEAALPLKTW